MLATLADHPFSDPNWLFEIKWDGVRALARIENGDLALRSRNAIDITKRYPELASLPDALAARQAVIDGEIVALDAQGHSSFERLQERMHVRAPSENLVAQMPAVYFAFDLLYCDGYDLRDAPLLERKQLLQRLLYTSGRFRYADHQLEHGKELFALAEQNGLEGIVAKRADSPYVSDRSAYWVKLKITKTVDAVVGGWTEARTPALPFGSLLLGLYEGKKLRFIGHVGSGFDAKKLKELSSRLKELATPASPFDAVPETNEKPSWVTSALVARVKFSGWTQEHALRHAVFHRAPRGCASHGLPMGERGCRYKRARLHSSRGSRARKSSAVCSTQEPRLKMSCSRGARNGHHRTGWQTSAAKQPEQNLFSRVRSYQAKSSGLLLPRSGFHFALSARPGFGSATLSRRDQGPSLLSKRFAGRRPGVVQNRAD